MTRCVLVMLVLAGCLPAESRGDIAQQADGWDGSDAASRDRGDGGDGGGSDVSAKALPELTWRELGVVDVFAEGITSELRVSATSSASPLVLRVRPHLSGARMSDAQSAAQAFCYRLAGSAEVDGGFASGFFVLPAALQPRDISFEVLDCATNRPATRTRFPQQPQQLRVERAAIPQWPAADEPAVLHVRIGVVEDNPFRAEDLRDDPVFRRAWEVATERFEAAGIMLVLDEETTLDVSGSLAYTPGERGELIEVHRVLERTFSGTRFVPVVLANCLRFEDPIWGYGALPAGLTTRIPAHFDSFSAPAFVALRTGGCSLEDTSSRRDLPSPDNLGIVLAHELGHYLGLYHSDAPEGAHLAEGENARLMVSYAAELQTHDAWFTRSQAREMRKHPDLIVPEERDQ